MSEQKKKERQAVLAEQWFVSRLKTWRKIRSLVARAKERGVEQKDIADLAGMDPAQLNRVLRGSTNVTLRTMHNIARALEHRMEVNFTPLTEVRASNAPSVAYLDPRPSSGTAHIELVPKTISIETSASSAGKVARELITA